MRKKLGIAFGVLVAYGSLWFGCYVLSFFNDDWWGLPVFLTVVGGVVLGGILVYQAVSDA